MGSNDSVDEFGLKQAWDGVIAQAEELHKRLKAVDQDKAYIFNKWCNDNLRGYTTSNKGS